MDTEKEVQLVDLGDAATETRQVSPPFDDGSGVLGPVAF